MPHVEDKPVQEVCAEQIEELLRQSFVVAERLVAESAQRVGVSPTEGFAAVPMVAMEVVQRMGNVAYSMTNMSGANLDKVMSEMDAVIRSMVRRNKASGEKKG